MNILKHRRYEMLELLGIRTIVSHLNIFRLPASYKTESR